MFSSRMFIKNLHWYKFLSLFKWLDFLVFLNRFYMISSFDFYHISNSPSPSLIKYSPSSISIHPSSLCFGPFPLVLGLLGTMGFGLATRPLLNISIRLLGTTERTLRVSLISILRYAKYCAPLTFFFGFSVILTWCKGIQYSIDFSSIC